PATAGVHRFIWDLHYAAPLSATRGYPISAVPHATPRGPEGPLALPGGYRVRLTVEGQQLEAPLELTQDPRVHVAAGALQEQLRLASELAALLDDSSRTLLAARSEQAQLKAVSAGGDTAEALHGFAAQVEALLSAPKASDKTGADKANAEKPTGDEAPPAQA